MRAISRKQITTVETQDELIFRVVRDKGWVELVIESAVCAFIFFMAYRLQSAGWTIVGFMAVSGLIVNWLKGNTTELLVTRDKLSVRGNVRQISSNKLCLKAMEIRSLGYEIGGEYEPSGLYARQRHGRTCLLSSLNEKQSIEIATEIYRRFPEIGTGDTEPGSILFGRSSEPVTIGLSRRD